MSAPRGRKLHEHGVLAAHRTAAVGGQPAEVWALIESLRDDAAIIGMFEDARTFLETYASPCFARVVGGDNEEMIVVAPPWIGLDVIAQRTAEQGGAVVELVIALVHGIASELAALPATVALRSLDLKSLAVTTVGGPRVLDLTLARFDGRRTVTDRHVVKGVMEYMSPENLQGVPLSSLSDIFSLGSIAYELLVGRRRFVGRDLDMLRAIQTATVPDVRDDRDDLPEPFVRVLERMFQPLATARPTWPELAAMLAPIRTWSGERVFDEIQRLAPAETEAAIVYGF